MKQDLDYLLNLTEEIKSEIKDLKWDAQDVRHSFLALYYSSVYDYYIGSISYEISNLIGKGKIMFTEDVFHLKPHVDRLYEISKLPIMSHGYQSSLNRSILYGVWTSFEFCISIIFDYLINDHEYEKLILMVNSKLLKAISELEEEYKLVIIEILKNSSFIPLFRKFNFIINQDKSKYTGDLKEDRKFVDLFGTMRNCMIHSNGMYHGTPKDFDFNGVHFKFRNKEIFSQQGDNELVSLEMAIELKEIFIRLLDCVSDIEFIPYPDDEGN